MLLKQSDGKLSLANWHMQCIDDLIEFPVNLSTFLSSSVLSLSLTP